jgi:hypothetical protein
MRVDKKADACRGPAEADAQTTRIAVLLDEMLLEQQQGSPSHDSEHTGHILVEVSCTHLVG